MPHVKSKMKSAEASNSMYILTAQRKGIKDSVLFYLAMFAVFLGGLIIFVCIACAQEWTNYSYIVVFIEVPLLGIAMIACAFKSIRAFSILHALNRIRSESAETVKVECKDVRFITYNPSRRASLITVIVIVGANHKKYIYVLPETQVLGNTKKRRQYIIDKYLFETVDLLCYKGTRMLKHLDVKFFDIRDRYRLNS